ncbi:hypothetical protein M4951_01010 [Blastopirellula sp. J2-11]|uniref:hypothetical protein n=1 Tax=Blastopirellula sp. J2-11 TaxID=2943192 RepID=UPI0021C685BF|nr:hypothetical protein [Blastopirellula sp. J2-11]UUO06907.1 hypothetical protein M4951_01010 [Blastopirellula sp. J2-11]
MELRISKNWFEDRIQTNENYEVGAGAPTKSEAKYDKPKVAAGAESPADMGTALKRAIEKK